MAKTLVIGYGNTLRRDDGVGVVAAERLSACLRRDDVEVLVRHQLDVDMAEPISQAGLVIFIDAQAGAAVGQVRVGEVPPEGQGWGAMVHQMSPGALLGCAHELYGRAAKAMVIGVGAEDFELGEGLSPKVANAVEQVVREVQNLLDSAGA